MKKITYLVAPLMVMPFLLGCNKVKTHKFVSVQTVEKKLKFTTMKDKDLKGSSFNHKQNLKFKVEATNDDTGQHYTVDPNGIGIYIGKDAMMPLLDGYTVEHTKTDKTAATVTIAADKVTDDIYIRSIAAKDGSYIYSVPLMYGVEMAKDMDTLGWQAINAPLGLEFKGKGENLNPDKDCFLYTDDAENFYYADDTTGSWYEKHIECQVTTGQPTKITVKADSVTTGYLLISARSGDKDSFLDAFSWDEIKALSQDGTAKYLFSVGDKKTVKLKYNDKEIDHVVKIIGFDHDYTDAEHPDDTKVGLTFQFDTAITFDDGVKFPLLRVWNEGEERTAANFEQSSLNKCLQGEVFDCLPDDLSKNIETVSKKVGKYTSSWKATSYPTKLFPLSAIEMSENPRSEGGTSLYCLKDEGTTYSYYEGEDVHTKRAAKAANGVQLDYWLRSPSNSGNKGYANYVLKDGHFAGTAAAVNGRAIGVVPAFCI